MADVPIWPPTSGLFLAAASAPQDACHLAAEAKMIHQFDHRWCTYGTVTTLATLRRRRWLTLHSKQHLATGLTRRCVKHERLAEEEVVAQVAHRLASILQVTTDERTMIANVIPWAGVGDSMFLLMPSADANQCSALIGCLNSLALDFVVRQKVGGANLSYHFVSQFPVPSIASFASNDFEFVCPRVLELVYTSHSMTPFARDLGHNGPPFPWNENRRAQLRAELDAWYARAYALTRDELRYILDPADVMGEDFPSETFRGLKYNEMKKFGEYRTRRLVLEAWDRLAMSGAVPAASVGSPYPARKALVDPANLADGAWAATSDSAHAALAQLAALIKVLPGPTPIARVRLAALFALEPRHMTQRLSAPDRDIWLRLVGPAAHLPRGANIASFAPKINANWQSAVTQLRGMGAILEDASAQTWAQGTRVHEFVTETWPDGRAAFVMRVLESLSLADATSDLQPEDRAWVEAYAA